MPLVDHGAFGAWESTPKISSTRETVCSITARIILSLAALLMSQVFMGTNAALASLGTVILVILGAGRCSNPPS